jgi:NAD(P)-dependent dehydrogenase (short-subunit alcohol dehydrogenase family)
MAIDFTGRVTLVTGGGNGLGRDYCLELARRGAKVVVNDLGGGASGQGASQSAADEVVDAIRAAGGEAVASYDSVATRAGGAAIVQTALDRFGRLDAVINNAGFLRNNRFEDLTDTEIDAILDVHLKGAFYVSQPAYRAMKANGYGRFLFTGSASAMFGHAWQANYAAAKGGLMGLSHIVALEGERHGIRSNLLMPTAQTRLAGEMHEGFLEVPSFAAALQRIPFAELEGRIVSEFNTPLAVYLVSEACTASHHIYSQLGGRYARVRISAADGWLSPGERPPTVEDLAAHWGEVEDDTVRHHPFNVYEEFEAVLDHRHRQGGA